jgi:hypothetical protein
MALARTSTTVFNNNNNNNNNAYHLSHNDKVIDNGTICPPSYTPRSQSSLFQNTTQTVQVNEFIDNITRNNTYNFNKSFFLCYLQTHWMMMSHHSWMNLKMFPFLIGKI